LVEFLQEEYLLIENDVHERTITCRLAHRLSKEFPHHYVDVEYNRYFSQPKKLSGRRIFPDIVVHKRNEQNANILAIEIKKNKNNIPNRERERLIFFTKKPTSEYNIRYCVGLYLNFNTGKKRANSIPLIKGEVFANGGHENKLSEELNNELRKRINNIR